MAIDWMKFELLEMSSEQLPISRQTDHNFVLFWWLFSRLARKKESRAEFYSWVIPKVKNGHLQLLTWRSVTLWLVSLWELHMGIATLNRGYGKSLWRTKWNMNFYILCDLMCTCSPTMIPFKGFPTHKLFKNTSCHLSTYLSSVVISFLHLVPSSDQIFPIEGFKHFKQ